MKEMSYHLSKKTEPKAMINAEVSLTQYSFKKLSLRNKCKEKKNG